MKTLRHNMKRSRRKFSLAEQEKWLAVARQAALERGAVEVPDDAGRYTLDTPIGELSLRFSAGDALASIFCRFANGEKAAELLGRHQVNHYSGKWNWYFDQSRAESTVSAFIADLERICPLEWVRRKSLPEVTQTRFTLADLQDNRKLVKWLGLDGNAPTVSMPISRYRPWAGHTVKEVADESTAEQWWNDYRETLALDWRKSKDNPYKPQTHAQFIDECLRAIGIKRGGTVKERIERAKIRFPDIYSQPITDEDYLAWRKAGADSPLPGAA